MEVKCIEILNIVVRYIPKWGSLKRIYVWKYDESTSSYIIEKLCAALLVFIGFCVQGQVSAEGTYPAKMGGLYCGGNCVLCIDKVTADQCVADYYDVIITNRHLDNFGVEQCVVRGPCWNCPGGGTYVSPMLCECPIDTYPKQTGSYDYECSPWFYLELSTVQTNQCDIEGNPCSPATGAKQQTEVDYQSADGRLRFVRSYNSLWGAEESSRLGKGWRHNFAIGLQPLPISTSPIGFARNSALRGPNRNTAWDACRGGWNAIKNQAFDGQYYNSQAYQRSQGGGCEVFVGGDVIAMFRIRTTVHIPSSLPFNESTLFQARTQDGDVILFKQVAGHWETLHGGSEILEQTDNGWRFTSKRQIQFIYNDRGQILRQVTSNGDETLFDYNLAAAAGGDNQPETLDRITGPFGRILTFHYNAQGQLIQLDTPDGLIQYTQEDGNLVAIQYPDTSSKQYHYENPTLPHHLTGITNENGERFATWVYDDSGRVVLSEHAGGAEQVKFTYNADGTTSVQQPNGASRTYHFEFAGGVQRPVLIEGDACTTCPNGQMKERRYDANGFLASYTDWNGITTSYTRDSQGRELSRTEAVGTPEARTIATDWHPHFRKPIRISEPGRITEFTYDDNGRLLSKQEREVQ